MGYYKDKERGTWYVEVRYKDIYGSSRKKKKEDLKKLQKQKNGKLNF